MQKHDDAQDTLQYSPFLDCEAAAFLRPEFMIEMSAWPNSLSLRRTTVMHLRTRTNTT